MYATKKGFDGVTKGIMCTKCIWYNTDMFSMSSEKKKFFHILTLVLSF